MVMRVVALLDYPSSDSFGMVAIVVEEEGRLKTLGLAKASQHRGENLTPHDLDGLIRGRHARAVDHTFMSIENCNYAALWLGKDFSDHAHVMSLPIPRLLPESGCVMVQDGRFLITDSSNAHAALVFWIDQAFECFLKKIDRESRWEIARLMSWVLPNHDKTLAARWKSAPDRNRELHLQLRTFKRGTTAPSWIAHLEQVFQTP